MFRFGFICYPTADPPVASDAWHELVGDWRVRQLGDFELLVHPEAEVAELSDGGTSVALIGRVASVDCSLEELLRRLATGTVADLVGLLGGMVGRFALIVTSPDGAMAFNDPIGSRSLFYRQDRKLAVASHAQVLGTAYGSPLSESTGRLIKLSEYRARNVQYLPGDATVYADVFGLAPNNYVDLRHGGTVRYWPNTPRRETSIDEFLARADEVFRATASLVADRRPIVGYTGGIDTRTVLAYLLHYDAPVEGVTWLANYIQPRELPVIEQLLDHRPTAHAGLDTAKYRKGEIFTAALVNAGRCCGGSAITSAMHAKYGADSSAIFVRGYGGEIVRGFYNLGPSPMRDLSPSEMARAYSKGLKGIEPSNTYVQAVVSAFEGFRERANYDDLHQWGFDPNDLFYWEHRMGMWGAAMCNSLDLAVDNLVGINGRRLYETAFGLPNEIRLTKELLREVIRRYDRGLAAIKYY